MIDHVWSVLCQSGAIDQKTNTISIFQVLETLTVIEAPEEGVTIPIPFEIFSLWIRSDEEVPSLGRMRVLYRQPQGEEETILLFPVDLSKSMYHRTRLSAQGLRLPVPGRYSFVIDLQLEDSDTWQQVANLPLHVTFQVPETPVAQDGS